MWTRGFLLERVNVLSICLGFLFVCLLGLVWFFVVVVFKLALCTLGKFM